MSAERERYHIFYGLWNSGARFQHHVCDSESEMLAIVKTAKDDPTYHPQLMVIWGEELTFKPAQVVETWAVVDPDEES